MNGSSVDKVDRELIGSVCTIYMYKLMYTYTYINIYIYTYIHVNTSLNPLVFPFSIVTMHNCLSKFSHITLSAIWTSYYLVSVNSPLWLLTNTVPAEDPRAGSKISLGNQPCCQFISRAVLDVDALLYTYIHIHIPGVILRWVHIGTTTTTTTSKSSYKPPFDLPFGYTRKDVRPFLRPFRGALWGLWGCILGSTVWDVDHMVSLNERHASSRRDVNKSSDWLEMRR